MSAADKLHRLDDRVLGDAKARAAWGQRHGWALTLLLGLILLAICAWALAVDRPAIAGMNIGFGVVLVVASVVLYLKRPAR